MLNAFTVDVEDYFQVTSFDRVVPRSTWDSRDSRVVASTERLLDLVARHQVRGTFWAGLPSAFRDSFAASPRTATSWAATVIGTD
jgi:hypothetical protein